MTAPATIATEYGEFRELAFRTSGGLQVSLLWERLSNAPVVAVFDRRQGHYFEVPVKPGQDPLDVFRHPYAYLPTASPGTVGGLAGGHA
jgi:hypothetical protein